MMDMNTRVERLRMMVREGRIIRDTWSNDDGMCLLAAISPEVARAQCERACPSSVMPLWLAYLTPDMNDFSSIEAWANIVQRYADLAARWHVLSPEAWERARVRALLSIVQEARSHVSENETQAIVAIDAVIAWLEAGAPEDEYERVHAAAWAAADDSTEARAAVEAMAAMAAEWATRARSYPTGMREAARRCALATAASVAETWNGVAENAVWAESWDRISHAVLDAIEAECEREQEE